jgi:hypothetical protein
LIVVFCDKTDFFLLLLFVHPTGEPASVLSANISGGVGYTPKTKETQRAYDALLGTSKFNLLINTLFSTLFCLFVKKKI